MSIYRMAWKSNLTGRDGFTDWMTDKSLVSELISIRNAVAPECDHWIETGEGLVKYSVLAPADERPHQVVITIDECAEAHIYLDGELNDMAFPEDIVECNQLEFAFEETLD